MDNNKTIKTPGYRVAYNVNGNLSASNETDNDGNPTGGYVLGLGTGITWQNGPRGQEGTDELLPANGAFVEDVIWAALQRLEFFNDSKYRDRANSIAITKLEEALYALKDRQLERSYRGVEGKYEA